MAPVPVMYQDPTPALQLYNGVATLPGRVTAIREQYRLSSNAAAESIGIAATTLANFEFGLSVYVITLQRILLWVDDVELRGIVALVKEPIEAYECTCLFVGSKHERGCKNK